MIALAAVSFDPDGHLILQPLPSSEMSEITRRMNRVATLDGGVVVNDSGHSAGDRTFRVRWRIRSESELRAVQRMVRMHPAVIVSARDGVFRAAPSSVEQRNGEGVLLLLVLEELT